MLMIFLAVVIGFDKEVPTWDPPPDIWPVLLKTSPFPHTCECFSRLMQIQPIYFYSRQPYLELFVQRAMSWTQQHGLPPFTDDDIKRFFDQQWTLHTRELAKNPRFSFQKIKHLQQWLPKEAILHHADHEQAKLTVFVLGCIFKALGIHGVILNFFADYPLLMNKHNREFMTLCPQPFKRNTSGLSIPNLNYHMDLFFPRERNSLRRAEL